MGKENKKLPRGLRNCNPLNIRKGKSKLWMGEIDGTDQVFCTFSNRVYGYRAAIKIMQTYQKKYNCWNLHDRIARWAPPTENKTGAYIGYVCDALHCYPSLTFDFCSSHDDERIECCLLIKCMAVVENGCKESDIDLDEIIKAYDLANNIR